MLGADPSGGLALQDVLLQSFGETIDLRVHKSAATLRAHGV